MIDLGAWVTEAYRIPVEDPKEERPAETPGQ
jgi:endogenous inhibitor of DNA gyrase (YacG/DUF329 family)